MSESAPTPKAPQLLEEVLSFVEQSQGLKSNRTSEGGFRVTQSVDGKAFSFRSEDLSEVVHRFDTDGKGFIQVNFTGGLKVLLTDSLVGFKPVQVSGLDMNKLPKVVTTPDLVSVLEAIEETLSTENGNGVGESEVEVLKRVYQAILVGGETAGFDLAFERRWLARLAPTRFSASA